MPPAALAGSAPRMASIDLLRMLAAVGIVWFHTDGAPHAQIGYAGLPIFLLIYFSLLTQRSGVHAPPQFVRRRRDRLLRPWLFWCAVYGACRLAKAAYAMDPSFLIRLLSLETFLAGPFIHLWYLPYAFASGLLLYLLNRRIQRINDTLVVLAATLTGVLLLVASTLSLNAFALARPLPQWEFGLAAIPLGLAVGRCLAIPSRRVRGLLLSLIAATTLGASVILVSLNLGELAVPYSVATVLVCLAYSRPGYGSGFAAAAASLTLGIYLIHPLVIPALAHVFPAQGHYPAFVILATCISGMVTWGLLRTPLRRFV